MTHRNQSKRGLPRTQQPRCSRVAGFGNATVSGARWIDATFLANFDGSGAQASKRDYTVEKKRARAGRESPVVFVYVDSGAVVGLDGQNLPAGVPKIVRGMSVIEARNRRFHLVRSRVGVLDWGLVNGARRPGRLKVPIRSILNRNTCYGTQKT